MAFEHLRPRDRQVERIRGVSRAPLGGTGSRLDLCIPAGESRSARAGDEQVSQGHPESSDFSQAEFRIIKQSIKMQYKNLFHMLHPRRAHHQGLQAFSFSFQEQKQTNKRKISIPQTQVPKSGKSRGTTPPVTWKRGVCCRESLPRARPQAFSINPHNPA